MNSFFSSLKLAMVSQVIIGMLLVFLPLTSTYAKAGCCSKHGGVAGCASTGYQLCKDNSVSPSCKCDGTTSMAPKTTKVTKTKTSKKTETVTPVAAAPVETNAKTKGCCARHGGVDHCDKATGHQVCKDGSKSSSCKC